MIICSDLLWDEFSTSVLVTSITRLLAKTCTSRVLVVAGAHTGRAPISAFLRRAAARGLIPDDDDLWEREIDGATRPWDENLEDGDIKIRNRWLMEGRLKWSKDHILVQH